MSEIRFVDGPLAGTSQTVPDFWGTEDGRLIGGIDGDGNLAVYRLEVQDDGSYKAWHVRSRHVPDPEAAT